MTNEKITDAIINAFSTILATHGERNPYKKVKEFVDKFDSNSDHACLTVYDDFGNECEYWGLQDYFFYFTTEFDEEFGTHTGYIDLTEWLDVFGFEKFEDSYFDHRLSGEWIA